MAAVHGPYQEIPNFDQRVDVDPISKDFWGIFVPRLSGKTHEEAIKGCTFLAEKSEEWDKRGGCSNDLEIVGSFQRSKCRTISGRNLPDGQ